MLRKVDSSSTFCNNFDFAAGITTEALTCLATNSNSTFVIGLLSRIPATRQIKRHGEQ